MYSSERAMTERDAILTRYHRRIANGERTRLTAAEQTALVDTFVADLTRLTDAPAIQERCRTEIAMLEAGYPVQTVASRMLAPYRKAIRDAVDDGRIPLTPANSHTIRFMKQSSGEIGTLNEHWALTTLKYDAATYQALRGQAVTQNNVRQDHLQPIPLDAYLAAVDALLERDDPGALTAGIAAATGRRHTEIISRGTFAVTDHPYQLSFTGQQKKRDDTPAYPIVTLRPASAILSALKRLRRHPRVREMANLPASDTRVRSFNSQVNYTVQQTFGKSGIVPQIAGARSVSVHRLRGVYVAIAIYFWCPPDQHEHRFIQAHLGHVLDGTSPNSTATTHYFHYRLVDAQGQPLLGKGVMLRTTPTLPESAQHLPAATGNTRPLLRNADIQRLYQITDELQFDGTTAERLHALLTWATSQMNMAANPARGTAPTTTMTEAISAAIAPFQQTIADQTATIERLTATLAQAQAEGEQAAAHLATLQSERERLNTQIGAGDAARERLEAQIATLHAEREQLAQQAAGIAPLRDELNHTRTTYEAASRELATLRQQYAIAQSQLVAFHQLRAALLAPQDVPLRETDTPPPPVPGISAQPRLTPEAVREEAPPPTRATPRQQQPEHPRTLRGDARIQRLWELIQHWNAAPGRDDNEKVQVNAAMLETRFGVFRQNAKRFVETHQDAIDDHHQTYGVGDGRTHNRSVPDYVWEDIRAALDEQ